jgi:hypothetical protein
MAIEDKSQLPPLSPKQLPPFSPEDEKKAQQELARLRKKEKGTSKTPQWLGFKGKTLRDWLQLLGIPNDSDQRIANQQHAVDQQNALEQQRATILQTYLDNIQDLLLHENLRNSKAGDEVAILARARTLTALQGLDSDRKGRLVQFLWEAQLIGFAEYNQNDKLKLLHKQIIDLRDADLSNAILTQQQLDQVYSCKGATSPKGLICKKTP